MSPQEMQVLQNFLDQLVQVQGVNPDPQAANMINAAVARQADASYLLVQRVLLQEQALTVANSQIASLQADLREQKALNAASAADSGRPFLDPASSAWGNSAASRPLSPAAPAPTATATSVTGQPLSAYPAVNPLNAPCQAPQTTSSFFGNTGGSMLGTVAATAASVAAGAFLYQGLNHLIGQGGHASLNNDSGANLTNNQGDLLPGYFDQGQDQSSQLDSASGDDNDII